MPEDPARAGRGAGLPGGAVLPQSRPARALPAGKLWDPPRGVVRDQHGGVGAGRQGQESENFPVPEAAVPHAFRGGSAFCR